ncbi:MAG: response regulator transcription factor [Clostridia bacterium]|nr:response regulator transcription factor [Clostridia bacterium]
MLRFVLCDDNKTTLNKITSTLKSIFVNHDIDAEVSFAATNSTKLIDYLSSNKVDVIFLDIDLSNQVTGIDLARQIRTVDKYVYIVFLTAHFEYSMLAYKVKTFDFLMKPITYSKLEETVLRLCDDIYDNKNMFVKLGSSKRLFRVSDISYIEKEGAKATVHTTTSDFQIYGTVEEIRSCLPGYFVRCSKSFIVNSQKITNIDNKRHTLYIEENAINYSDRYITDERKLIFNEGITY